MTTSYTPITLDQLLDEADHIYNFAKSFHNEKSRNVIESAIRTAAHQHKDFYSIYGIMLTLMFEEGGYDRDVFKQYVQHIIANPWKTREDFLNSQVDYYVTLMTKRGNITNQTIIDRMRKNVYDQLYSEHLRIEELANQADKNVKQAEAKYAEKYKEEIMALAESIVDEQGKSVVSTKK
jgi:hypothetical protein